MVGLIDLLRLLLVAFAGPFSHVGAFSVTSTSTTIGASTSSSSSPPLFSSHFDKTLLQSTKSVALTYLEINGWLLTTGGKTILIDPILDGDLDFGIPSIYSASKRVLPSTGLCELLPPIDCLLITQGLDDHAHERTLKKLTELWNADGDDNGSSSSSSSSSPSVPMIVAPPSARDALIKSGLASSSDNDDSSGSTISYIRPGESINIEASSNNIDGGSGGVKIKATSGALVGPPWQARENGYIISSTSSASDGSGSGGPSIYIEPHVEFNRMELAREAPVDIVITPITGQGLTPLFQLVHGPSDALRLVQTLRPKYVIPMQNGDVDAEGLISSLVQTVGSPKEFEKMLLEDDKRIQNQNKSAGEEPKFIEIIAPIPGKDIILGV